MHMCVFSLLDAAWTFVTYFVHGRFALGWTGGLRPVGVVGKLGEGEFRVIWGSSLQTHILMLVSVEANRQPQQLLEL